MLAGESWALATCDATLLHAAFAALQNLTAWSLEQNNSTQLTCLLHELAQVLRNKGSETEYLKQAVCTQLQSALFGALFGTEQGTAIYALALSEQASQAMPLKASVQSLEEGLAIVQHDDGCQFLTRAVAALLRSKLAPASHALGDDGKLVRLHVQAKSLLQQAGGGDAGAWFAKGLQRSYDGIKFQLIGAGQQRAGLSSMLADDPPAFAPGLAGVCRASSRHCPHSDALEHCTAELYRQVSRTPGTACDGCGTALSMDRGLRACKRCQAAHYCSTCAAFCHVLCRQLHV